MPDQQLSFHIFDIARRFVSVVPAIEGCANRMVDCHGAFYRMISALICMMVCLLPCSGCNYLPANRQVQQYQVENERLLSEFRAQKRRADELQERNAELAKRVDESEKMLARVQNNPSINRLSAADQSLQRTVPNGTSSYPGANLSDPNSLSATPDAGESPTSGTSTWRPIARTQP